MWIFIYSARPATTKTQAKDKGKKLTEKCKGKLCEELARNTRLTILSMLMLHSTIILRMQHAPMCCIHQHVYVHLSLSCHDRTYALNYVYGIPLVVTAKWHPQPVTNIKKNKDHILIPYARARARGLSQFVFTHSVRLFSTGRDCWVCCLFFLFFRHATPVVFCHFFLSQPYVMCSTDLFSLRL